MNITKDKNIDLHIAFDEIKRSNSHVSESTAQYSTNSTGGVELRRVHLDLPERFIRSLNHHRRNIFGARV